MYKSTQQKDTLTGSQGEMTMWWLFHVLIHDNVVIENNKYAYINYTK